MNHFVALDNFILELLYFLFVHGLYLVIPFEIALLEVLEFALELFELSGDSLVVCSQLLVGVLESLVLFLVLCAKISISSVENTLLLLEFFVVLVVFFLLLLQNFEVVVEFFSVKLIECLHLLIAFLEVLYILFHLDFSCGVGLHALNS